MSEVIRSVVPPTEKHRNLDVEQLRRTSLSKLIGYPLMAIVTSHRALRPLKVRSNYRGKLVS
jgi:hypothetical protein